MSTILNEELGAGTVGCLGEPHVQVLMLADLKIDGIVAVDQIRQLIENLEVSLGIEFAVFTRMR